MGLLQVPLAGGAIVEFDPLGGIEDIGNGRGVPKSFTLTHPGGPQQPSYRFQFGVMDGKPVCVGVHIEAKDGVPVRTRDLTNNHIDKIVITAVGAVGHESRPPGKSGSRRWLHVQSMDFNADNLAAGYAAVKQQPRTRRKRDDVDLGLVAQVWRTAPSGAKQQALMAEFHIAKATASRYKKRAEEAGLLDG